jgi:hypothetical protein
MTIRIIPILAVAIGQRDCAEMREGRGIMNVLRSLFD